MSRKNAAKSPQPETDQTSRATPRYNTEMQGDHERTLKSENKTTRIWGRKTGGKLSEPRTIYNKRRARSSTIQAMERNIGFIEAVEPTDREAQRKKTTTSPSTKWNNFDRKGIRFIGQRMAKKELSISANLVDKIKKEEFVEECWIKPKKTDVKWTCYLQT